MFCILKFACCMICYINCQVIICLVKYYYNLNLYVNYYLKMEKENGKFGLSIQSIIDSLQLRLFERNYKLMLNTSYSFKLIFCIQLIFYAQQLALLSNIEINPYANEAQQSFLFKALLVILNPLVLWNKSQYSALIFCSILLILHIVVILCFTIHTQSKQMNQNLSKIVTIIIKSTTIMGIVTSAQYILSNNPMYVKLICFLLLTLAVTNWLINEMFHFSFTILDANNNFYVRNPKSVISQVNFLLLIIAYSVCKIIKIKVIFSIYFVLFLLFAILKAKKYCLNLVYHQEKVSRLMGIFETLVISTSLCFTICFVLDITLIKDNLITFILGFFVFLSYFFLNFRKFMLKNIIIDEKLQNEEKTLIYIVAYFSYFRNKAIKKNQLYISSLLKNHVNLCNDAQCCCKMNRNLLYDYKNKKYGEEKWQLHMDDVFIKHFFLRLTKNSLQRFPKSNLLELLYCQIYLQLLGFIAQATNIMNSLRKKSIREKYTFSERFLIYCQQNELYRCILENNNKSQNLDLEKVMKFDELLINFGKEIKTITLLFCRLWKDIYNNKITQGPLIEICRKSLSEMNKIQNMYHEASSINKQSNEFKALMLFYAKHVIHDFDFYSEILKNIQSQAKKLYFSDADTKINIFDSNSITIRANVSGIITYASKRAHDFFKYASLEEFLKLKINSLMPKYFAQRHNGYIQNWIKTGTFSKLNRTSNIWISCKDGEVLAVKFYAKLIPMYQNHDYEILTIFQRNSKSNEIICGKDGQIYGTGKTFAELLITSPKKIQHFGINLQILLPDTNEYFMGFFADEAPNPIKHHQIRKSGYFPGQISLYFNQLWKQKLQQLKNEQKKDKNKLYLRKYANFIKNKMQEITVNINGQYVTLTLSCKIHYPFLDTSNYVIVFKINAYKINTIERYYEDLERGIKFLSDMEREKQKIKEVQKEICQAKTKKIDFFKIFLKHKKIKKVVEEGRVSEIDIVNKIKGQDYIQEEQEPKETQQDNQLKQLRIRKKLALNSQIQFKSDNVRQSFKKVKRALFQNGIINYQTYRFIKGKEQNKFNTDEFKQTKRDFDEDFMRKSKGTQPKVNKTIFANDEQLYNSQGSDMSDNSQTNFKDPFKESQHESFLNSTSSSTTTFFALTNYIKTFKRKLKSLHTPPLLFILNITLVIVLSLELGSNIFEFFYIRDRLQLAKISFSQGSQSSELFDSICLGKIQLINLKFNPNEDLYTYFLNYYSALAHKIDTKHVNQYSTFSEKNQNLLSYRSIPVGEITGVQNMTMIEFIRRQHDYIRDRNIVNDFTQLQKISALHSINLQIPFYSQCSYAEIILISSFLILLGICMCLTCPIVYKLQHKVQQIMELMAKISLKEKKKYFHNFQKLKLCLKHDDFQLIYQQFENHDKENEATTQNNIFYKEQNDIEIVEEATTKKEQRKQFSTIYKKIGLLYLVIFLLFGLKFGVQMVFINVYSHSFDVFNKVFIDKQIFMIKLLEFKYMLETQQFKTNYRSDSVSIVSSIYDTYHLISTQQQYKNYLKNITIDNICQNHIRQEAVKLNLLDYCQQINTKTLKQGIFNSFVYLQRKTEFLVNNFLKGQLTVANFITSQKYKEIELNLHFANLMSANISKKMIQQIGKQNAFLSQILTICVYVLFSGIILFGIAWWMISKSLSERVSYVNAFLLLIPFDILTENPYIKLYIKKQFNFY